MESTAHERLMAEVVAAMAANTRKPLLDIKVTVGCADLDQELGQLRSLREAAQSEDLGDCELCSKPLAVGQFVNHYDDVGSAHANCDQPFAKPTEATPAPSDDGRTMRTFVLLGTPAVLFEVDLAAETLAA